MSTIIKKTFGGLTRAYYMRHLFFGACIGGSILAIQFSPDSVASGADVPFLIGMVIVNTLLYPYARFVYELVANFILGDTLMILPLVFSLIWKLVSIAVVWAFAIFIAPIGLLYLFIHHSRSG